MTIYVVAGKWYYKTLDKAIEKAKEYIIDFNTDCYNIKNDWEIKTHKSGKYTVQVTIESLYRKTCPSISTCTIRPIEIED